MHISCSSCEALFDVDPAVYGDGARFICSHCGAMVHVDYHSEPKVVPADAADPIAAAVSAIDEFSQTDDLLDPDFEVLPPSGEASQESEPTQTDSTSEPAAVGAHAVDDAPAPEEHDDVLPPVPPSRRLSKNQFWRWLVLVLVLFAIVGMIDWCLVHRPSASLQQLWRVAQLAAYPDKPSSSVTLPASAAPPSPASVAVSIPSPPASAEQLHMALGDLYLQNRKPELAVMQYQQALLLNESGSLLHKIGQIQLQHLNQQIVAVATFRQWLQVEPQNPEAHYWLAQALLEPQQQRERRWLWRRYLKLAPQGEYAAMVRVALKQG